MADTLAELEEILQRRGWSRCGTDDVNRHLWSKSGHFLITSRGANTQVQELSASEAVASQLTEERLEGEWCFDGNAWSNGRATVDSLIEASVYEFAESRHSLSS